MKFIAILLLFFALVVAARAQQGGVLTTSSADCTVEGSCVSVTQLNPSTKSITVTMLGQFINDSRFEGTYDNGLNWVPLSGLRVGASTPLSQKPINGAVAPGSWRVDASGLTGFRVRCNQVITGYADVLIRTLQ